MVRKQINSKLGFHTEEHMLYSLSTDKLYNLPPSLYYLVLVLI